MAPVKKAKEAVKKIKKSKEDALHKIPLRITDTTLRDAHQSLWATRMRTTDILDIVDVIDNVGYYSLEMWGGATFDVCLRFLRENPWERLREVKKRAKKTPLQMLLRGQNLVGYKNYADDVVDKFVEMAHANGIDIFRVFDALNDIRNLESAVKAVKKHGGHAQGTLAYTISPVHTIEKYVQHAKDQKDLGVDSICIKDMAGILSPITAEKLVSALVKEVKIPVQLHCHGTSGMAIPAYVEAVRAGAGAIDCAISSMAGMNAQPPVETLATIFNETNYSPNLDFEALEKVAKYFDELKPKRRPKSSDSADTIDPGILIHQIPGGMISNFRSQLDQQGALDKLPEALKEVTKVREDLGFCPLVTPTSQIVGTQAVMNVLVGERYKVVPNEVKQYVKGMYGRPPLALKDDFITKILGDEKPIDFRPGDNIEPMLPTIADDVDPKLIEGEEDLISYCLLPEPALAYFKWRATPEEEREPIPADLEMVESSDSTKEEGKAVSPTKPTQATKTSLQSKGGVMDPNQMLHIDDYKGLGHIISSAAGMQISELVVQKGDFCLSMSSTGSVSRAATPAPSNIAAPTEISTPEASSVVEETVDSSETENSADSGDYANTVDSPLGGTFYAASSPDAPAMVQVGDKVKKGDKVCIIEAMKLFNEIEIPEDGTITAILVNNGDAVDKDQPLVAYDPA